MSRYRIVLASASPRRLELLRQMGFDPDVRPADIPEDALPLETPVEQVRRLAEAKGRKVADSLRDVRPLHAVVAADTVVVADRIPLGKPADPDQAREMLRRLSGRTHEVLTGMWIGRCDDGRSASWVESTRVRFHRFPEELVRWYVSTGEPLDKAGAYAIQGLGALLVSDIDGSWTNVVGLPVERLPGLLHRIELRVRGSQA